MMKRITYVLLLLLCFTTALAGGIKGEAPTSDTDYYLYNVYQAKFLGFGNAWGTQISLLPFGHTSILKCTFEDAGNGTFRINTHYDALTNSWQSSSTNWVYKADLGTTKVPVVNANYYDEGGVLREREATRFSIEEKSEGYLLIDSDGDTLKFEKRDMCTFDIHLTTFEEDKALWRFVTEAEYNAMSVKKRFTATALNVDGLPERGFGLITMNPDSKGASGATAISNKLANMGYDIIGVSEDFNYNAEIYSALNGGYTSGTWRGGIEGASGFFNGIGALLGGIGDGIDTDGLNFFTKNATCSQSNESWTMWNKRNGTTNDGSDELIRKGYRYYTVTLTDGTEFDFYILHMDAETSSADITAREVQLTQLADAILTSNNGRPIIVMGDTNCRYTRDRLKALFIDAINADSRFTCTDAWVEHSRLGVYPSYNTWSIMTENMTDGAPNGTGEGFRRGEVVDKVIYINNTASDVRIEAEFFTQDLSFINDSDEPLADHWPISVTFSYHTYDPEIDEVATTDLSAEGVYLRNVGLSREGKGAFLKAAGWWGTHAYTGTYGIPVTITKLANGKYSLSTGRGGGFLEGVWTDSGTPFAWTVLQNGNHFLFTDGNGNALGPGDYNPYAGNNIGPNDYYLEMNALDQVTNPYLQWEVVTLKDLQQEMKFTTEQIPYNCTFLLPGANFDRNDGTNVSEWLWTEGSGFSEKGQRNWGMTDDSDNQRHSANNVYEVYIGGNSSSKYTTWKLYQTLTGLPDGHYRVTCQGFYRDGDNFGTAQHSRFYVSSNGATNSTLLPLIQTYGRSAATNQGSEIMTGGKYVPNCRTSASHYFALGDYSMSLAVDVIGGMLELGIEKTGETKSTSSWTCFDNFQLIYLGPFNPIKVRDVNKDGKANTGDIKAIAEIIIGTEASQGYDHEVADTNGDGHVTTADLTRLTNILNR